MVVEERLQPTVKGYIQGNTIHLPPSSPDAAMEILRHELTHRMQELSPRQYGKYRDYVIRQKKPGFSRAFPFFYSGSAAAEPEPVEVRSVPEADGAASQWPAAFRNSV